MRVWSLQRNIKTVQGEREREKERERKNKDVRNKRITTPFIIK